VKELEVVRALRPLRRAHPHVAPAMLVLGLLAALSEGVGLSLFLPLLHSLDSGTFASDAFLGRGLEQLFVRVPAGQRLLAVSMAILALVLAKNLLVYANGVLTSWSRILLVHSLRVRLADRILGAGCGFADRTDSGRLLNALQHQTQEVGTAFAGHVDLGIRICGVLVFSTFLLLVSWRMSLAVGLALLAISCSVRLAWRRIEVHSERFVRAWDELSQRALELLGGLRTIHVFDRVDFERERFARASARAGRVWFHLDLVAGLVRPASEVLIVVVLVALLLATLHDTRQLPTVLTFSFLLYRLRPHVQGLDGARAQLLAVKAPVETVMGLLDAAPEPPAPGGRPFAGLRGSVRLEGVSYRPPGAERDALHRVSATIPAGRTTAVIGRSGAGKSTLVELLLRLSEPAEGRILVDGVPLGELDLRAWRERVAAVSQDPMLFNDTVHANIAYGRLDASRADVERAARRAGADEFVRSLPRGYDTVVGDRGVRLSAGQRQRLALARALVREPEILLLDEATNALDGETESLVQQALAALGRSVTVVVVSHHPSALARADRYLWLEDGRLRAEGERAELEADGGALRGPPRPGVLAGPPAGAAAAGAP
jgi:subfamily B ATP-binding cassette protein MsbA